MKKCWCCFDDVVVVIDTVRVDVDEGDDHGNDYNDNKEEEEDTVIPEKIYLRGARSFFFLDMDQ